MMMKLSGSRKMGFGLLLVLTLAGCAQFAWVKPGATPSDFGSDEYACLQSAMTLAPPLPGTAVFWNKDGIYHDRRAYGYWDHSGGQIVTTDVNAENRNDLVNACLQAKGWQWVDIQQP